jgi:hypothetical protein
MVVGGNTMSTIEAASCLNATLDTSARKVNYRGITGVVRRAVNKGIILEEITPEKVRSLLPEGKNDAPDNTILASLQRLAYSGEIIEDGGKFFPKDVPLATQVVSPSVSVIGELKSIKTINGVTTVTIEVTELEYI